MVGGEKSLEGLCPNCLAPHEGNGPCLHCGYISQQGQGDWNRLRPGALLRERYLIGGILGRGGFGITYRGKDIELDMPLAIKEYFPAGLAARESSTREVYFSSKEDMDGFRQGMEKFLEEARVLARYENDSSIVSVRDHFRDNGTAYMVMPLLMGTTLKEYLEKHGEILPFDEAMQILSPIMDALDRIHADGFIHRDISPDNIFLTRAGQAKLLDFGAAKSALSLMARQSHSIILKKGYSPVEQYQTRGALGPWTDVYGMAATLYRMVTGQLPPDSLDRLSDGALLTPTRLGHPIPPRAELALLRALAVNPKDRPQSMMEFKEGLNGKKDVNSIPTASNQEDSGRHRQEKEAINDTKSQTISCKAEPSDCIDENCSNKVYPADNSSDQCSSRVSVMPDKPKVNSNKKIKIILAVGLALFAALCLGLFYVPRNFEPQNVFSERDKINKAIVDYLLKKAKSGEVLAQLKLGQVYTYGIGVPVDYKQAFWWYKRASEQGNPDAMCRLGICYQNGLGKSIDSKMGLYWLKKAEAKGNYLASCFIGIAYLDSQGVEYNKEQIEKHFDKVSKNKKSMMSSLDPDELYAVGRIIEEKYPQEEGKSNSIFQKSAQLGNILSLYHIGEKILENHSTKWSDDLSKEDEDMAMKCFEEASGRGYAYASATLARLYISGGPYHIKWNIPINKKLAFELYNSALKNGYASNFNLFYIPSSFIKGFSSSNGTGFSIAFYGENDEKIVYNSYLSTSFDPNCELTDSQYSTEVIDSVINQGYQDGYKHLEYAEMNYNNSNGIVLLENSKYNRWVRIAIDPKATLVIEFNYKKELASKYIDYINKITSQKLEFPEI